MCGRLYVGKSARMYGVLVLVCVSKVLSNYLYVWLSLSVLVCMWCRQHVGTSVRMYGLLVPACVRTWLSDYHHV